MMFTLVRLSCVLLATTQVVAKVHIQLGNTTVPLLRNDKNSGLLGYDCSGQGTEYTRIAIDGVAPCLKDVDEIPIQTEHAQVIQKRAYEAVYYQTCLAEITRLIYYCGNHEINYLVDDALASQITFIGRAGCQDVHNTRTFKYAGSTLTDLTVNASNSVSVTLCGTVDSDGWCSGCPTYKDRVGTYKNVVVIGYVKLTLSDGFGRVDTSTDRLLVKDLGLSCDSKDGYCKDTQKGEVIWSYTNAECVNDGVDVLYEGKVTVMGPPGKQILYVTEGQKAFAVNLKKPVLYCTQRVVETEHPRLIVSFKRDVGYFFSKSRSEMIAENVDLSMYIGAKFQLVTVLMALREKEIYRALRLQACEARRLALENRLALATMTPNHVGMLIEGEPGIYGRVMGETLYIEKCSAVIVEHDYRVKKCYQELPVVYNNKSMFLQPVTRILTSLGREVMCNPLIAPHFHLGDKWYVRHPTITASTSPTALDPNVDNLTFVFDPVYDFSIAGIYSIDQLRGLQQEMMFPVIKDAVADSMVRTVAQSGGRDVDYGRLLSEDNIANLTDTIGSQLSWLFAMFGRGIQIVIYLFVLYKTVMYAIGVIMSVRRMRRHGKKGLILMSALSDPIVHYILDDFKRVRKGEASSPPPYEISAEEIHLHEGFDRLREQNDTQDQFNNQYLRPYEPRRQPAGMYPHVQTGVYT